MALFSDSGSPVVPSPVAVTVGQIRVHRSAVTANGEDDPTWGAWAEQPLLKCSGIFRGSSFAGMSYAKLTLAPGRPYQVDDTRIEDQDVLKLGDRVAITMDGTGTLFVGYMVQASIVIEGAGEALSFKVAGPEWVWGDTIGGGSYFPVVGQVRRKGPADDAWADDPAVVVTVASDLDQFSADPCIFNPGGRRNMTWFDVELTGGGTHGRCFEIPDRKIGGNLRADFWTQRRAVEFLCLWFNLPAKTGVDNPDFGTVGFDDDKPIRDVDVEGLGLWGALKKVLEPEWGFYVSSIPATVPSGSWTGLEIRFFKRSGNDEADLRLNALHTAVHNASASVVRLEASKDISKTITNPNVMGTRLKHVRLRYFGAATPEITGDDKKIMLQHGWVPADGDLADYAEDRPIAAGGTISVADLTTIMKKGSTERDQWRERYTVGGKEFAQYQNVFRLFVWNESGEWGGSVSGTPRYGKDEDGDYPYQKPDLTDITDRPADSGIYCRRRRPALDSLFLLNNVDAWQRVPPTLYVAALPATSGAQSPWVRVPTSKYRLDPERCAIWIVAEDLARWSPLFSEEQTDFTQAIDGRSFATLLYTGDLRLMLECSIEADWALTAFVERSADAGSPFRRYIALRRESDYFTSDEFDDGLTSPSGLTVDLVNTEAAAVEYVEQLQAGLHDQQTHASVLVEADWPGQPIGSFITATSGRVVNLQGGPASKGALIVAQHLDTIAMKWELLTESAALQLRDYDRRKTGKKTMRRVFKKNRGFVAGVDDED